MISVRQLFVFAIMAVMRLEYSRASRQWNKVELSNPITFDFEEWDTLKVYIILKELPHVVNQYALYFNHELWRTFISTDKKIYIERKLQNETFVPLDIYLFKDNQTCRTKRIMYGMRAKEKKEYAFTKACLRNNVKPCEIIVEFTYQEHEKCKAETMKCEEKKGQLSCKTLNSRARYSEHQWYQKDRNGSLIGTIPMVKGKTSKFIFQIQKFDIMSTIIYDLKHEKSVPSVEKSQFQLPNNYEPKRYMSAGTIRYSELKNVTILCSNDEHTQVGLIDPTREKITTYNVTSYSGNHGKTDNGSMLCCLRYSIKPDKDQTTIQRYVENVNVLLYEEQPHQDITKCGVATERSTMWSPSSSIPEPAKGTVTQKPIFVQGNMSTLAKITTTTETTLNVAVSPVNLSDPQEKDILYGSPVADHTMYYIAMASVAGIILFVSLIYVIVKKCTRKASNPETLELETYASTNILYAELDIKTRQDQSRSKFAPAPDDTTYAQIIGVVTPHVNH